MADILRWRLHVNAKRCELGQERGSAQRLLRCHVLGRVEVNWKSRMPAQSTPTLYLTQQHSNDQPTLWDDSQEKFFRPLPVPNEEAF